MSGSRVPQTKDKLKVCTTDLMITCLIACVLGFHFLLCSYVMTTYPYVYVFYNSAKMIIFCKYFFCLYLTTCTRGIDAFYITFSVMLLLTLTAWGLGQFAILPSDGTFHGIAPRPFVSIRITAVIHGSCYATICEISINLSMIMGRSWVPALTSITTDSNRCCTRITIWINVFTWALVWKN